MTKKIYYIALPRATVPSLDRVETGVVIRPRTGCRELVDALIITRYVGGDVANSAGTFFATCFAASSPRPAVFNNMFLMDIGRLLLRRLATDFDSLISTSIITKPPTPRSPRATATCQATARQALGAAFSTRTAAIQTETTAAGARRGAREGTCGGGRERAVDGGPCDVVHQQHGLRPVDVVPDHLAPQSLPPDVPNLQRHLNLPRQVDLLHEEVQADRLLVALAEVVVHEAARQRRLPHRPVPDEDHLPPPRARLVVEVAQVKEVVVSFVLLALLVSHHLQRLEPRLGIA